ncbi:polysaccharide pyruvyl transferase family protein [Caballeronia sp. BR00000012568055]|uniref:polysaccharide pyruvyl transferase family protein n=1 Tax=Caballeronia sp. BR00000012568055 TaxID=2918761 RepID=UPI0023F6788F|nr:polysaccharide pyruvyl transferase family protein [Caballeronia sp. BR00000012568055]
MLILFGAFDRHSFGDMLFAHIAKRLIPKRLIRDTQTVFAGLAARDLRAYGGHKVVALSSAPKGERVALLHVGGEILTCGAEEAAVMLGTRRALLGTDSQTPYVLGRETFACASSICFNAVGGASLDLSDTDLLNKLRSADHISVRDLQTHAALKEAGIDARLTPDPASLITELFDARAPAKRPYIAVQFSADYGDDATLERIASQLDRIDQHIVLFRAGAAPWHDDIDVYKRLLKHLKRAEVTLFDSLNIWDINTLIANSEAYAGSSLHGRIVAMAHGMPRANILHPESKKQSAYVKTWDASHPAGVVEIDDLQAALYASMQTDRNELRQQASELARLYQVNFAETLDALLPK